jgi:hypothetical protein
MLTLRVRRLDVPVDNAMLVGVRQALGHSPDASTGLVEWQRTELLYVPLQIGARYILHHQVEPAFVGARVVGRRKGASG